MKLLRNSDTQVDKKSSCGISHFIQKSQGISIFGKKKETNEKNTK
jgi:hypothetical protein